MAANIVGWLAAFGYTTILVDCDEPANRTSSNWITEALPQVPIQLIRDADELWDELPKLREHAEYVVVDTPGTSEMIRQVFMRADVAVIPTKAGKAEADPLIASVRILRQSQEIRHGRPRAHVVLSQVGKRFRNTRAMRQLAEKLEMPLAQNGTLFHATPLGCLRHGHISFGRWAPMRKRLRPILMSSSMRFCRRRGRRVNLCNM